ncbi:AMPKBI domain-containing protein [Aphelenchoides besseyi]|nr:AMPKBI domain-containing protein [Aphelenchoides besseyi]
MGNTQGGPHKRERTNDGSQRPRALSGTVNLTHSNTNNSTDDGCPVQMRIKDEEFDPSMDLLESDEYPVVFKWTNHGGHPPRMVHLSGSWDGKYEYKYLIDGKWQLDNQAPRSEGQNGVMNNTVNIDEADFEVFNALDKDLAASNAGVALLKMNSTGVQQPSHDTPNDREIEKLREFTQTLPDRRDFEKAPSPPVLPPHLLQVILNKDTPVSCDPNVLPEPPHHVMLNHLYALSIKDGVMVLSATHRHRKKYVFDDGNNNKRILVDVNPEVENGYEIVVSFVVVINESENWINYDLWKCAETVWETVVKTRDLSLAFRLEVHDVLVERDLHSNGGYRNLRVLSVRGEYFVNATELKEIGGSLFQD